MARKYKIMHGRLIANDITKEGNPERIFLQGETVLSEEDLLKYNGAGMEPKFMLVDELPRLKSVAELEQELAEAKARETAQSSHNQFASMPLAELRNQAEEDGIEFSPETTAAELAHELKELHG